MLSTRAVAHVGENNTEDSWEELTILMSVKEIQRRDVKGLRVSRLSGSNDETERLRREARGARATRKRVNLER